MHWISVNDRLPELEKECLLLFNDLSMDVGHICDCSYEFFVCGGSNHSIKSFSHWLPLSEIPLPKD